MNFIYLSLVFFLTSCNDSSMVRNDPKLETYSHSQSGITWADSDIEATTRWRFISSRKIIEGIEITGAWDISLYNPDSRSWKIDVGRLSFHDVQGFQIAEYRPKGRVIYGRIDTEETIRQHGNFTITVASITSANSITRMNVWASFWR